MSFPETSRLEPFGVKLHYDLREPMSNRTGEAFRELVLREGLVVASGPILTMDEQIRVMSAIGPILTRGSGVGYVAPDDGVLGTQGLDFHSDISFAPEPFDFISLHGVELVANASWTRFVHAGLAYDRLPSDLKARIEALKVGGIGELNGARIPWSRKAVMRRKETGRPILYFSRAAKPRFSGMNAEDSKALVDLLFSYLYDENYIFHHSWNVGDILIWDNLALQHARPDISSMGARILQRVVVANKSMLDQIPSEIAGITYEGKQVQGY